MVFLQHTALTPPIVLGDGGRIPRPAPCTLWGLPHTIGPSFAPSWGSMARVPRLPRAVAHFGS